MLTRTKGMSGQELCEKCIMRCRTNLCSTEADLRPAGKSQQNCLCHIDMRLHCRACIEGRTTTTWQLTLSKCPEATAGHSQANMEGEKTSTRKISGHWSSSRSITINTKESEMLPIVDIDRAAN